jgi:hypothetical protein
MVATEGQLNRVYGGGSNILMTNLGLYSKRSDRKTN